jgi:hypothetical protein
MTKKKSTKLPKALSESRDARELFTYLLRKASLSPEDAMAPRHGIVRRVVLSTLSFNDRLVTLLERVPNLSLILEGLEELRLAQTGITKSGIERLRSLLPDVKVNIDKNLVFRLRKRRLCSDTHVTACNALGSARWIGPIYRI